jgi:hypothetical protein
VKVSTGIDTYFSESVAVGSFYFNAYFKDCNVNAPCKLQEGVEYDNLKKKYASLRERQLCTRLYLSCHYLTLHVL